MKRTSSFDVLTDRRNTGSCKWEAYAHLTKDGDCIPLTVADMELPIAEPIKAALVAAAQHGICGYTQVDELYLNALTGFMKRHHGLEITEKNLICTSGIVPAFGIVLRALTQKGDGIIVQPPVYTPFFDAIRANERVILENPLLFDGKEYRMDYAGLEELCKSGAKLLMLCSPHNPVGRVWTREELQMTGDICKKYGVVILCDEIHNDMALESTHTALATLPGMKDIVITCTAMSKTFNLAGLMLSNIFIFNEDMYKKVDRQLGLDGSHCIPYFGRAASIAAFSECDEWIEELKDYLRGNFELCYNYIAENMPNLECIRAEGTYLLWVNCKKLGLSDKELLKRFEEEKVPVNPGTMFGTGGSGFVRINVAMPRESLMIALEKIKKAVNVK